MREARIILPVADNEGRGLEIIHGYLAKALCTTFGGATVTASNGMWCGPDGRVYDEPGKAYDVAMDATRENASKLRRIAIRCGRLAKQLAVYVRLPDGSVEIIDLSAVGARKAA